MKWFWGLLLLIVGTYFLGINLSFWSAQDLVKLVQFWPLLLILYGVSLIARHWKFGWIVILAAFWAAILFVYNVSFTDYPIVNIDEVNKESVKTSKFSAEFPSGAKKVKMNIKSGAVNFDLKGGSSKLIEGTMESTFARAVLDVDNINGSVETTLKTEKVSAGWWRGKNNLEMSITNKLPLSLDIDAGASDIKADLSDIILEELNVDSGASSIDLKIGDQVANDAKIDIDAGASSIDIKLPKSIGATIKTNASLSNRTFENFNQKENNLFESENYDTASKKISIEINAGVSTIKVSSY